MAVLLGFFVLIALLVIVFYLIYKMFKNTYIKNKIENKKGNTKEKYMDLSMRDIFRVKREESLEIFFQTPEINKKLIEFILNNTWECEKGNISGYQYNKRIEEYLYLINKSINYLENSSNNKKENSEKFGTLISKILLKRTEKPINKDELRNYIDQIRLGVYIENIEAIEPIENSISENFKESMEVIENPIKKYIYIYGEKSLRKYNIEALSKLLNEDYFVLSARLREAINQIKEEDKQIRREENKKTLELLFENRDIKNRLEKFILNNTRKYDEGEINKTKYDESLTLFLEYIIKRVENDIYLKEDEFDKNLKEHWKKKGSLGLSKRDLEIYLENEKEKIYTSEMKSVLKIKDEDELEDKIQKYVTIFGESSLETFNLRVFSMLLNIDSVGLSVKVKREYDRERREYELRKMEDTLFGSSINKKDLKYIDSLSGFEFEDYLEDLFIEFGYRAKDLPYSNDYGADLIISKGLEDIVIQAKKYNSNNVGVQAVQEVIAAKSHYKTDIAMVITNSYYTANALEAARISDVIMIDRDDLARILKEGRSYFNSLIK